MEEVIEKTSRITLVKQGLKSFHKNPRFYTASFIWSIISTAVGLFFFFQLQGKYHAEQRVTQSLKSNLASFQENFMQDRSVLVSAISVYEEMTLLPPTNKKLSSFKDRFALILKYVSDKNNSLAAAELQRLSLDIAAEKHPR